MPFPSFRTFVGVAKDNINAQMTSAIAIGATSLPIQNLIGTTGTLTTAGATYSAIIVDGFLTETVACSGNLSAGAIPCAATVNAHSVNAYVAFQLTASVGASNYIPIETFTPTDVVAQLIDKSLRGYAAETYGIQSGARHGTWDIAGTVFPDTFGYILGAHFGADSVTGAGPYTHKFSVNNTGTYQPTHYLLYSLNGFNTRIFAGALCDELTVTFDPAQLVKYNAKWIAHASGVVATPTQSYSNIVPIPAWEASVSVAGTVTGKIRHLEAIFKREQSAVVEALTGNQDPYSLFVGPQSVKGKMSTVKEDDGILNYFVGAPPLAQPAVVLTLTNGTGGTQTGLNLQMTKTAFTNVLTKLQGASFVEEEVDFEGIANSTDGVPGTGSAPAQVQLLNAVATAATFV